MEAALKQVKSTIKFETNGKSSRIPGFYKLDLAQRLDKLDDWLKLTRNEKFMLKRETLTSELADIMIENAIGVFGLPLGMAVNLRLNDKDYLLPMAIEESSVVAAASNAARLIRENGMMMGQASEQIMISQIQIVDGSALPIRMISRSCDSAAAPGISKSKFWIPSVGPWSSPTCWSIVGMPWEPILSIRWQKIWDRLLLNWSKGM
jgi:hypothetical protein